MEAQSASSSNSASNAPPTPDSTTHAQEFMSTGRTGRRNALPGIHLYLLLVHLKFKNLTDFFNNLTVFMLYT